MPDLSLLLHGDFVLVRMALVDAVGWTQAAVLQRIAWRCEHTGEWAASHAVIATEVRMSERTVREATKSLRAQGWLAVRDAGPFDKTSVWSIPGGSRRVETAVSAASETADSAASSSLSKKKDNDGAFERFWKACPKRTGGKIDARKAWDSALKVASADKIIEGMERYAAWCSRTKREAKFIKQAGPWLRAGMWDDELPEPPRSSTTVPGGWR